MSSFVLTNSTPLHPRKLGHPLRSSLRCGFVLRFACTHLALSVTSTSLHPPLAAVGLRSSSSKPTRSAGLGFDLDGSYVYAHTSLLAPHSSLTPSFSRESFPATAFFFHPPVKKRVCDIIMATAQPIGVVVQAAL